MPNLGVGLFFSLSFLLDLNIFIKSLLKKWINMISYISLEISRFNRLMIRFSRREI